MSEQCALFLRRVAVTSLAGNTSGYQQRAVSFHTSQCSVSSQHRHVMDWMFCCCSSAYIKLPIFAIFITHFNHCR